jgi:hypothetical protein
MPTARKTAELWEIAQSGASRYNATTSVYVDKNFLRHE